MQHLAALPTWVTMNLSVVVINLADVPIVSFSEILNERNIELLQWYEGHRSCGISFSVHTS